MKANYNMKKAVILSGGVQHLVSEGDELLVNYVGDIKSIDFEPLMIVDGKDSVIDSKSLGAIKVSAKVLEDLQGEKVIALRYKAKKRVHTKRGHRQKLSRLQITAIK
jgi:large subunit ribosomal protein L21